MKIKKITQLFTAITLLTAANASAQTLVLEPGPTEGKDAYINSNYPTANYEDGTTLYSGGWTWGGAFGAMRSFFQFDLSSIPGGSQILSAELKLYNDTESNGFPTSGTSGHNNLSTSNASYLSRVDGPWDESTITWDNQPTFATADQVPLAESTSPTENYSLDVTNIVAFWAANPSENNGFVLRMQHEDYYAALIFGSSDNTNANLRPRLEVTYDSLVGLTPLNSDELSLRAYPNPFNGLLNVQLPSTKDNLSFSLVNNLGQEIEVIDSSKTKDSLVLNTDSLKKGVYFLRVETNDGRVKTIKVIKSK